MGQATTIETHYTQGELFNRIMDAVSASGTDPAALTPDDLDPVDAFHIGRGEATRELAALAGLKPGLKVLDVGCGLGGTCRYLATAHRCRVTGIDVTQEFCDTAARLSECLGLSDRTEFRRADALVLPFERGSFDVVWTEHAQMNVKYKWIFYAQIARVLAPEGRFVFHDIFSGRGGGVVYPVPWADRKAMSYLISPEDVREMLTGRGFRILHWSDVTATSLEWIRAARDRADDRVPPLGTHLLMGNWQEKLANVARNLEENRITVIQGVLEWPADPHACL